MQRQRDKNESDKKAKSQFRKKTRWAHGVSVSVFVCARVRMRYVTVESLLFTDFGQGSDRLLVSRNNKKRNLLTKCETPTVLCINFIFLSHFNDRTIYSNIIFVRKTFPFLIVACTLQSTGIDVGAVSTIRSHTLTEYLETASYLPSNCPYLCANANNKQIMDHELPNAGTIHSNVETQYDSTMLIHLNMPIEETESSTSV